MLSKLICPNAVKLKFPTRKISCQDELTDNPVEFTNRTENFERHIWQQIIQIPKVSNPEMLWSLHNIMDKFQGHILSKVHDQ